MLTECTHCSALNTIEPGERLPRCEDCGCLLPAPELQEEDA